MPKTFIVFISIILKFDQIELIFRQYYLVITYLFFMRIGQKT